MPTSTSVFYHCKKDQPDELCSEDVHAWFGLTYASYLTLPRSLLQEMPAEWQHAFARLLDEMSERFRAPLEGKYIVMTQGEKGRFIKDPLRNYRHPSWLAIERAAQR